jgi:hypothetical protein
MLKLWTQHNTNPIVYVIAIASSLNVIHRSMAKRGMIHHHMHAVMATIIKNMMRVYVQQEQNTILRIRTKQNMVMTR